MYLEKINGPENIKKLRIEELQTLADETRNAVINRISKVGGHSGPNLGMVEMTVAMHYVFLEIVLHIHTIKGKGLKYAEENR